MGIRRDAVRRLMWNCDVIVFVQDDDVDSDALSWELDLAGRHAQRRPVFVLRLGLGSKLTFHLGRERVCRSREARRSVGS